ncbi:amino acid adenylation domain-containing protein [Streptomyces sp. NBC_01296]|uniref:amino acid adenylation domain-containing protein n=1 Tax=Streptomyces sp. NBC_01296 TaxID=2903816 RepID=UPI002E121EE5|nr:amino acid adenylation domain-containing protein [Streptomyces sp. NBC_01296]
MTTAPLSRPDEAGAAVTTVASWQQTLAALNDTAAPVPRGPVAQLLAERARPVADRPAVLARDRNLTHGELHGLAEALAVRLRERGAGPGVLVRVCLPRSAELVVAVLAVLRAGAAYVPLDPDHPAERLAQLVDSAPAPITLTSARLAHLFPAPGVLEVDLDAPGAVGPAVPEPGGPQPGPADLAYVIHTSGSTGRPKGVAIEQHSLANLLEAAAVPFGLAPGRRVLQFASPAFDVSVWEILATLWAGAAVVVFDEPVASAEILAALVRERRADTVFLLAALLAQLDPAAFPGVRTVVTGGESFSQALVDRWAPGRDLIYVYGPTEATVFQSWHRCLPGAPGEPATIGRPMANLRYSVRDGSGVPVGPGVDGELWIGGAGVGRGYLGLPDAGAPRFVRDPDDPRPGARLYRTGDLARHRADGTLDFRGRADRQLKIRGFRIEPGEVEVALTALPGVAAAAVVVPEGTAQPLLAGYVVTDGPLPADWRARLAERLPYYMVPAAVIPLDRMPSTPNGKIDRRNLSARPLPTAAPALPADPAPEDSAGLVPCADAGGAADSVRAVVRDLFSEAFGRPVPDQGDFFLLGGNSLKAAALAVEAAQRLSVPVRVRDVFECPCVTDLADRLATRVASATAEAEAEAETGAEGEAEAGAPAGDTDGSRGVSGAQRWLWLENRTRGAGARESAAYHVPMLLECHGDADPEALGAAFARLQELHPQLRTVFHEEWGEPVPGPAPERARLAVLDLPDEAARAAAVQEWAHAPFDLAQGPLVRAALLRRPGGRDRLLVVLHHIVGDQTSLEIIARALAGTGPDPAPGLPGRAAHEPPSGDELPYWRSRLSPPPAPLPLPVDHPRTGPAGRATAVATAHLGAAELEALEELARSRRTGLFPVLAAAVTATLHDATGAGDISLGTAVSRRPALGPGSADAVGCMVNTVVLRTAVRGGSPCVALVDDLADQAVGAMDHGGLPFSELVRTLEPPRNPGRNPFFDVWVTLWDEIDTGPGPLRLVGGPIPLVEGLFDLSFQFSRGSSGLKLLLQYDCTLYEPGTAQGLAERAAHAARRLSTAGPQTLVGSLTPRAQAPQAPTGRPAFEGFSWGATRP